MTDVSVLHTGACVMDGRVLVPAPTARPEDTGAGLDMLRFGWQHPRTQLRLAGPRQATTARAVPSSDGQRLGERAGRDGGNPTSSGRGGGLGRAGASPAPSPTPSTQVPGRDQMAGNICPGLNKSGSSKITL